MSDRPRMRLHHEPEITAQALFERARRLDQVAGFGYEMADFLTDIVPFLDTLSSLQAQQVVKPDAAYLAAVKGRADFRQALRLTRPVIAAARALRDKWRTKGQKVDSDDFFEAIHNVSEAADAYDVALASAPSPSTEGDTTNAG